jgi:hypothetical protein
MADFSSPFVGITRIRFKGFVVRRLSHRGSPALISQNKTDAREVNTHDWDSRG